MNARTQYNKKGKEYIEAQKCFFGHSLDPANVFIKKFLPKGNKDIKILDFGCGHGKTIEIIKKEKFNNVFGIDCSEEMIKEAKKYLKSEKDLFVSNIEKTPFKRNFFDIVIGRFSLHYLKNFEKAYLEINRILKAGGIFIFIVDHPIRDFSWSKNKKYGQQEIINIKLYKESVSINFPTHTFNDYFSKTFQKYFFIDAFLEGHSPEAHMDNFHSPDYLAIKAIKR